MLMKLSYEPLTTYLSYQVDQRSADLKGVLVDSGSRTDKVIARLVAVISYLPTTE